MQKIIRPARIVENTTYNILNSTAARTPVPPALPQLTRLGQGLVAKGVRGGLVPTRAPGTAPSTSTRSRPFGVQ